MSEQDQGNPPDIQPDTAESVQADQTQDTTPPAPPPNDGPWAQDLAATFDDPTQRAAVDQFLREKVQPHVTQLEQASAPNRAAERLYSDFTESPVDTYYSVTRELFGEEAADQVRAALSSEEGDEAPDVDDDILADVDADLSSLPAEAREAIEYVQQQRQEEAFNAELDKIKADNPDLDLREDLFFPFVTAADGDLEVATANYAEFIKRAEEVRDGEPTPPPEAPATVGQDGTGTSTPPTEKEYGTLDEALDEYFAEQKSPPTTVGNV